MRVHPPRLRNLQCAAAFNDTPLKLWAFVFIMAWRSETGMFNTWFALSAHAAHLGIETQHVIGLRLMKIAAGGAPAQAEVTRMITEKISAFAEAAATLAMGGSPQKIVRRYRTHVKANARRLSRG